MPAKKLKEFLDSHSIQYITITHSTAYTSQQIAALAHIPGKELAKCVMVLIEDQLAMAVLPASLQVDLQIFRRLTGTENVRLANEYEFRDRFPGCEVGAMPPFGNLYEIPVYVDETLTWDRVIAFNAGTHNELIRMTYDDFARLVKPIVASFGRGMASASGA
jgi:Ala-tRNA(Pro) deacylase